MTANAGNRQSVSDAARFASAPIRQAEQAAALQHISQKRTSKAVKLAEIQTGHSLPKDKVSQLRDKPAGQQSQPIDRSLRIATFETTMVFRAGTDPS